MGIKRGLFTRGKATGYGRQFRKKRMIKTKLSSSYNLCTLAIEELVAQIVSTYSLATAPT